MDGDWEKPEAQGGRYNVNLLTHPVGEAHMKYKYIEQVWCKALEIQIPSATHSIVKHYTSHTLIHGEAEMEYKKIHVRTKATCRVQRADMKYKYKKQVLLHTIHNTDRPI